MLPRLIVPGPETGMSPREGAAASLRINSGTIFGLLLVASLALKATTFGDLNRNVDETFYFLVGQRMHEGLLPYVDVWDRKPLGLFLVYYLIAGISTSVLSYQIVACVLSAVTATIVYLLVARWSGQRGGILAGLSYLFLVGTFGGGGGQSPDIYNPLIAMAFLLVTSEVDRLSRGRTTWRTWSAMALCGLALTIKQTTVIESLFLGLYVVGCLISAGGLTARVVWIAAVCCLLGAAPTLLIASYYWQVGHWAEFWHAMVTSNMAKARDANEIWHSLDLLFRGAVIIPFAVLGLQRQPSATSVPRLLHGWILAALVGFLLIPNFYQHYFLPLLVPLCVAAGLFFDRNQSRLVFFTLLAAYSTLWQNPYQLQATRASIHSMRVMEKLIREHDPGAGLLVFDGPNYLYALTGKPFLSPLVFPHHLNHQIENDVSHLNTHHEIERILAGRPGVVVMERFPRNAPVNVGSRRRVLAYVRKLCRIAGIVDTFDDNGDGYPVVVFGNCRKQQALQQ